jgi:hypothetical protein
MGLVADFGGYANTRTVPMTTYWTYLLDPRFNWRHSRLTPYAPFLFGGALCRMIRRVFLPRKMHFATASSCWTCFNGQTCFRSKCLRWETQRGHLLTGRVLNRALREQGREEDKENRTENVGMVGRLDWSGNVRELQNVAQRAMILYDGETFSIEWRGCSAKP